jgi:hypothetical protein
LSASGNREILESFNHGSDNYPLSKLLQKNYTNLTEGDKNILALRYLKQKQQ